MVIKDFQSIDWWSVTWGPLPKDKINGILRGYRLMYYMSYRSDIPIGGEQDPIIIDFDKFTFYYKATKLVNYATYNVTVTGFTNAGNGPTPEYYASKFKSSRSQVNRLHFIPFNFIIVKSLLFNCDISRLFEIPIFFHHIQKFFTFSQW